jgi:hypothetical protein
MPINDMMMAPTIESTSRLRPVSDVMKNSSTELLTESIKVLAPQNNNPDENRKNR